MNYFAHDVIAELAHAFDNYVESEGLDFAVDYDNGRNDAVITATAANGQTFRFLATVTPIGE